MVSIFDPGGLAELARRIESLRPDTRPHWGKLDAAQMLAHNSLIFEGARFGTYPRMNPVLRWLVSRMIRGAVLGDRPYPRGTRTAPGWVVSDPHDFATEKARVLANLQAVHEMGTSGFEGKANPTFGTLRAVEWDRLFCKHLDHHLTQFGV